MEQPTHRRDTMDSYRIDLARLTVIRTDRFGEDHDLNASGDPCATIDDLRVFVAELAAQDFFGADVADSLIAATR